MRPRLTYANIVATLALFIALGGATAFAASKLAKNSVGTKQLKKGAVTAEKVKEGSLLASSFKAGQLPAGGKGETGPQGLPGKEGKEGKQGKVGEQGEPGTPATKFFASVRENGTILHSSPGVTVETFGAGEYFATFPEDVTDCVAVGSIGETTGNGILPGEITTRTDGNGVPQDANSVDIVTFNSSGAKSNQAFNLAVFC